MAELERDNVHAHTIHTIHTITCELSESKVCARLSWRGMVSMPTTVACLAASSGSVVSLVRAGWMWLTSLEGEVGGGKRHYHEPAQQPRGWQGPLLYLLIPTVHEVCSFCSSA